MSAGDVEDTVPGEKLPPTPRAPREPVEVPQSIGRYRVLSQLGAGGMGVVYAAYDNDLDRKVAIKLVLPDEDGHGHEAALLREAQALAKVEHPHVVRVYEVGNFRGQVYLVMEFLSGATLRAWLRAEPRLWRQRLAVMIQAGRGLQAAHDAGVVHHDFKPDNVVVDASGLARVVDFGLAQAGAGDTEDDNSVLGTPRYMPPEQWRGASAGPRADQFSFAVTLYEVLYGRRPFAGATAILLREAIEVGDVPLPPSDSKIPRRFFRIIERALRPEPGERWPSMADMLAALEHDPWATPLRVLTVTVALVVVAVASYALATARAIEQPRCEVAGERLDAVWGEPQRNEVRRAFQATGLVFARDVGERVITRLEDYAEAWRDERKAVCEEHASGVQTDRLTDLRNACLDQRMAHLSALIQVFMAPDPSVVENAVQATASLPGLAACADANALLAVELPDDPAVAREIEALRARLARADVLEQTGLYDEGLQIAAEVRAEAARIGYAPLAAETALTDGRLKMASVRVVEAEAALAEAVRLGIANDQHAVAAEAAVIHMYVVGSDETRRSEGLAAVMYAEALVARTHGEARLVALLHNNIGTMHDDREGSVDLARAHYDRAIEALRVRGEADPLAAIVHHNLGIMYVNHGRLDEARPQFERARELFVSIFGADHPLGAHPRIGLGDVAVRQGAYTEAIANYREAIALLEPSLGAEHRWLIDPLAGLGMAYVGVGGFAEAQQYFSRALAIAEREGLRREPVGDALNGLAEVAAAQGRHAEARQYYARAAEMYDSTLESDPAKASRAALRAGELAAAAGERDEAVRWFERVQASQRGPELERGQASLLLATLLAGRTAERARVCALLASGQTAVPANDPRRAGAEALFASTCEQH
ncbi:protein kinase domain-containing protein [Nannocystis radixulma]|uniref:Tetratricopeptide repeat protein n=1 Tax=Nannocystis radixulma TaxID=2995305 RepID=A0ABT5BJF5_9BACT|nr:serine/threonine-protein kinase [Nannocystis radixulma]MDC0673818.1 tetratricopeptide repeat protein [Nannocystis radixulma]